MALRLALFATLVGCAPSIDHLLAAHHDREAICAVRETGEHEKQVADALFHDLAPKVHAEVVELAWGEMHVSAVRLRVATNAIPVDAIELAIDGPALERATLSALARRTQETLPGPYVVAPNDAGRIVSAVLTIISLGVLRIDADKPYERAASDEEIRRAAPRAFAAATALRDRCEPIDLGVAARCTYHFLVPDVASEVSAKLRITLKANAKEQPCALARSYRVVLGRADTLAVEVHQRFGDAFQSLEH